MANNELDFATLAALARALGGSADPAVIESAVSDWLDQHPEATTTVEDGSISEAKLDNNLKGVVADVGDLKTEIANLDNAVEQLEVGSLSALSASVGEVPVADGEGAWAWGECAPNKVDKAAILNAGITNTMYSTIIDETITTATDATHTYPYAEHSGGSISEKYKYRITYDGTEYNLNGYAFFKLLGNNAGKGVTYVGNPSLYMENVTGICNTIDEVPFCFVEMDTEFSGIQIYTETAGTHTIKFERITYAKNTIPEVLMYGINTPPIIRKQSINSGYDGFSIGNNALESSRGTFAIGNSNTISGQNSFAIGIDNIVSGSISFAIGNQCEVTGANAVAEGYATFAGGPYTHAEGHSTKATATEGGSHAEGISTTASGIYGSHAEGYNTTADGMASHAEGSTTHSSGTLSHAEGNQTTASGANSHAEGYKTTASGRSSHAEGEETISNHRFQHVFGQANVADPSSASVTERGNFVEIVGNGTANNARSNARTLDWSGNEALAGSITLGMGTADEVTLSAAQLKQLLALLN